jgi:hypothetical protein
MRNFFLITIIGLMLAQTMQAQEFQAKVTVNGAQLGSKVDRKIFQTLQTALTNFINNRKWSNTSYGANEKIVCSFLLNLSDVTNGNVFKGALTVQAARPVYNSTYQSPIVNFQDDNIVFKYVEFQPVEFNENRVSGNDPLTSNLSAVFAFYANIILGIDNASFALRGGDSYFDKAMNIVNNAPDAREIIGWRNFDGLRNRYFLADGFTNARFALIHDAVYSYYRLGMDMMYENDTEARGAVMNTLNFLSNINNDNPNSMMLQFFFQGKSKELVGIYKKASPDEKSRALDLLTRLDITNSNTYKQELK